MLRKALLILSGNAATSLFLLVRNLIIARMIPVADYGVAATFALVMGVVEMASALGLQQQIIQAKEGDDPHFQAALQGFQVLRGCAAGVALLAVAGPFARFLGVPEVAWAYQLLAVVPVLNALQHFDIHRLNRQMRFGPLMLTGTLPAMVTLALAWPLSLWFGNWQAMLWSVAIQAAIATITSHLMAERPYRLVWDRAIIAGSLRFGWPLLINAILMFLVFQGDKLIVSRELGMEAMAIFAMGMTLTLTPTLILAKSAGNLFLPRLSRTAQTPDFALKAQQSLQAVSFSALLFALLVLLVGGPVVHMLLGEKYAALLPLLIWLALGQALRVMKAGPALVALAAGHTANAMIANLVRAMALPFAWVTVANGGNLLDLVVISLTAEGVSLLVSLTTMLVRCPLPWARILLQQGMVAGMIIAIGVQVRINPPDALIAPWPLWVAAGTALLIALAILSELTQACRRK